MQNSKCSVSQMPRKRKRRRKRKAVSEQTVSENREVIRTVFSEYLGSDFTVINADVILGRCTFCKSKNTFFVRNNSASLFPAAWWLCTACKRSGTLHTIYQYTRAYCRCVRKLQQERASHE